MAKKSSLPSLTFRDLVLGADAETLRQALEARSRIDELITERQAAYERIATLETQIEDVIGEPGVFPFPPPPLPIAGIDPKADTLTRASGPAPTKKSRAQQPETDPDREAEADPANPADAADSSEDELND